MLYDDKKFIGSIIKTARQAKKLNQAQLAELIEMSDKNLGNIENGKQFPQVNNFLKIIEVLDLSLEDFGVKKGNKKISDKDELLRIILSSTNKEAQAYLKILKAVGEAIRDNK